MLNTISIKAFSGNIRRADVKSNLNKKKMYFPSWNCKSAGTGWLVLLHPFDSGRTRILLDVLHHGRVDAWITGSVPCASRRTLGRVQGAPAPSASFSRNEAAFPEQFLDFIWHIYIIWLFLGGQESEYLAFIVQVLGAGKEEGVEN